MNEKVTYAVGDGGHIKVGRTWGSDVDAVLRRMRQLQTGNPRPLHMLGMRVGDYEKIAHNALAHVSARRGMGEWFVDDDLTRETLRSIGLMGWG